MGIEVTSCKRCHGAGKIRRNICNTCKGSGRVELVRNSDGFITSVVPVKQ